MNNENLLPKSLELKIIKIKQNKIETTSVFTISVPEY